jgi:DNA-binding Xre family transcriptional regulator
MKRKTKKATNGKAKKKSKKAAKGFGLAKLLVNTMKRNAKSIRELAKEAGLSPTVIQKLRTGQQVDVKLNNFISIFKACGYDLVLTNGKERISL